MLGLMREDPDDAELIENGREVERQGTFLQPLALLSVWAIATGLLEIAAAIRLRKEIKGEWLLGISGLLSILLGVAVPVLLYANPPATILSVAWLIAAWAVIAGVVLIGLALRLRRRRGGPESPGLPPPAA